MSVFLVALWFYIMSLSDLSVVYGFPLVFMSWYVLGWSRFSYFLQGIGLPHEATLPQQFGSLVGLVGLVGSPSMSEVGAAISAVIIR